MKKLLLLMMIVCMAIPCFAGSPFNIWTRPDADWLTGQTPNFDPAWAWMKWMDGMVSPPGGVFYVNGVSGLATNDGLSWNRAKKTIGQGLALVTSRNSTVYVGGVAYTESIALPAFSCGRLIGVTNAINIPQWTSVAIDQSHLTMGTGSWEVAGFRFLGTTNTAPYIFVTGSNHIIRDNWFSGTTAEIGIQFSGGPTQCKILRNRFTGFTTVDFDHGAICGENYTQAAVYFEIRDNFFANNTKSLNLLMNCCIVKGNVFTAADNTVTPTIVISTYAEVGPGVGAHGGNVITENYFPHVKSDINAARGYEASTGDNWLGNFCLDGMSTESPISASALQSRRAGGRTYYVDNNFGHNTNTGVSWLQAYSSLSVAMAASHANIAIGPNWANRNTIYIRGDDFSEDQVTMAQKTDIIGIGSDDSQTMPRLLCHWAIPSGVDYYGTRFYNIMFMDDSGGGILFAIDNQDGTEFHECIFMSDDNGETDMLNFTQCTNWIVDNCEFKHVGTGAAIKVEQDILYASEIRITNNKIFSHQGIAIDWDENESINCWITDNYIYCYTAVRTIDCEATDGVFVINNRLITEVDTNTTPGDGYDFVETHASGNLLTGSGGDCNWIPGIE